MIIRVEDINDHAPVWMRNSYSTEVEENRIYGHLLHLEATDGDGSEAYFKICHYRVVTPNVPFKVDDDGTLIPNEICFEKQNLYH